MARGIYSNYYFIMLLFFTSFPELVLIFSERPEKGSASIFNFVRNISYKSDKIDYRLYYWFGVHS